MNGIDLSSYRYQNPLPQSPLSPSEKAVAGLIKANNRKSAPEAASLIIELDADGKETGTGEFRAVAFRGRHSDLLDKTSALFPAPDWGFDVDEGTIVGESPTREAGKGVSALPSCYKLSLHMRGRALERVKAIFTHMPERVFGMPPAHEFKAESFIRKLHRPIEANKPLYAALDQHLVELAMTPPAIAAAAGM